MQGNDTPAHKMRSEPNFEFRVAFELAKGPASTQQLLLGCRILISMGDHHLMAGLTRFNSRLSPHGWPRKFSLGPSPLKLASPGLIAHHCLVAGVASLVWDHRLMTGLASLVGDHRLMAGLTKFVRGPSPLAGLYNLNQTLTT